MRIPRLFVETPLSARAIVCLSGAQAHYLNNVLRCRPGSHLILFNGEGGEYAGQITASDRRQVEVRIESFTATDRESTLVIRLGLGITKRDAMDASIQKATELGVTEISPLVTAFTDVPAKALAGRHDHWLKIIRSACEQCGRNRPPRLSRSMPLGTWLESTKADLNLVAHPDASNSLDDLPAPAESIALLTGPEGGFSDEEVSRCEAHGFMVIGLGPRILRADTAPTVLLALIQSRFGDLTA